MQQRHRKFIALLRGVNVGGHNKVPMQELRSLCAANGWTGVRSYIQSGNLVFTAPASAATAQSQVEKIIERHFGISVPVIVRNPDQWAAYISGNPFPGASGETPNLVMLALSGSSPASGAEAGLRSYAGNNERVMLVGDALWIHFAGGSARSKLTPAVLDRLVGSPVTTRNWRTVLKLGELAGATGRPL